ncbi:MAG TPA: DUF1772 domain-containing protein [Propionibacteriaceae bacterium]|nr:DUF1772 domain-containing protein [Propionibacteriaceae bacterium]
MAWVRICGNTIMPGLRRTDDRDLRRGFRSIDRVIINPAFMATFIGALALTGLAALLQLAGDQRPLLPWIAAAFFLYLVVFVITIGVNVPRNNEIKAAGDIEHMTDPHGVRERLPRTDAAVPVRLDDGDPRCHPVNSLWTISLRARPRVFGLDRRLTMSEDD